MIISLLGRARFILNNNNHLTEKGVRVHTSVDPFTYCFTAFAEQGRYSLTSGGRAGF